MRIVAGQLLACAVGSVHAQTSIPPGAVLAGDDPDGTLTGFGDGYAAAADTWNDWLIVGSPRETVFRDGVDMQDGAAYVYRNVGGNYVFQQKITRAGTSQSGIGDRLGGAVAVENGWAFIGVANDTDFPGLVDPAPDFGLGEPFTFAGKVHVYRLVGSSWEYAQTLTAPVPKSGGSFGARSQASHIALDDLGRVALIGEINNFEGVIGELHAFRLRQGAWEYSQTISSPDADLDVFADEVVYLGRNQYLAGGVDDRGDGTIQGKAFVFRARGKSGLFDAEPVQVLEGPIEDPGTCGIGSNGFANSGVAASNGTLAIADPCHDGAAGPNSGAIHVYSIGNGPTPLSIEAMIEGDEPNLFLGANTFGAQYALAVSPSGDRILAGTPRAPGGPGVTDGDDVRGYVRDGGGWSNDVLLTTDTPANGDLRGFGDAVYFLGDSTGFVRENNTLSPIISGLKGRGIIYDLDP